MVAVGLDKVDCRGSCHLGAAVGIEDADEAALGLGVVLILVVEFGAGVGEIGLFVGAVGVLDTERNVDSCYLGFPHVCME